MPRISGIDIPDHKKVAISLRYIYGVGPKIADEIVAKTKISLDKRARDLTTDEISRIQILLEKYLVEGDLRRQISENIGRVKRLRAYRGIRHMMNLPCRGQRTRSNARTRRGSRRTVGALSKEVAAKLDVAKTEKAAA